MKLLRHVGRLFSAGSPIQEDVDILIEGDRIVSVGPTGSSLAPPDCLEFDCGGGLLTAGLVDAHSHPLYSAARLAEVTVRSEGTSYAAIAERGGGISSTVRTTRALSFEELEHLGRRRLRRWLEGGTTTLEAKTGYWLDREGELRAVSLLHRLADLPELPRLSVTYLAAHALPPGVDREAYVQEMADACPAAVVAGADYCDVFCDQGAFTVAETELILRQAKDAGLELRLHADELELTGGTRLAARLGAVSVDHLLQIGPAEIDALAASATVATLCPVTALAMNRRPPARQLLDRGVTLALGTDHNPGTSGTTRMSLVIWMAISVLGLSVQEALTAATLGGARSLSLDDRGAVVTGMLADLVLWDCDHEGAFAWDPGVSPRQVWRGGQEQIGT